MQSQDDLKQQIELLCIEKGVEAGEVMSAIENAIAGAYRREIGDREKAYQAEFDSETRSYSLYQITNVVETVENPEREISLINARLENPGAKIGDVIRKPVIVHDQIHFGRIASQVAKQILMQTLNNYRHTRVLQKFKDQIGDIVKVEIDGYRKGGYIVKLDKTMGYINRENLLPVDKFRPGQMVSALIVDIVEDKRGVSQIVLSRTSTDFIKAIIKREVPEVASEVVIIDKIVREPGVRSKILVSVGDEDQSVDPVGTILGRKNTRIINIMREISTSMSEKIDIVENNPDDLELVIMDALEPAEIEKVDIDEESKKVVVHCFPEEASLAVGRRGTNVRLASELIGYEIDIETIKEDEQNFNGPEIMLD